MSYGESNEAWIVGAVRTPIGRHGGALATVRPDDLGAVALKALMERTGVDPLEVEDVYFGCANQAGEDNRDVARMSLLLAGFPESVGGATVNRLCGSGLEAVANASRAVMLGEAEVYVGGGVESMSRAPFVLPKPERPFPTGHPKMYDTTLGWRMTNPKMEEMGHTDSLGQTAENLAEARYAVTSEEQDPEGLASEYDVSREAQDRFALSSHRKALAAQDEKKFKEETVPVTVKTRKGTESVVETDEGPRPDTTLEKLAKLRPAFTEGGSVTAGNSSSLNDGAAAVLVVSRNYAERNGLEPLAKVRSVAVAGVPPRVMGIGPVPATQKALDRAGLTMDDIGLVELNEAFAAQSLAVIHEWGMSADDERLNPNGGAIALGHPLGCSGARILTTLVHEMGRREDVRYGLATMCIGVGQGIAMVVERA
ncbi:AcCoA-C-Actrans: acetyl-CoA C-acetyltransferase [Rubrobacter radiotolerans]|uniref:acetyl-CoA C-acyltransferase n=1 Tax=Rubrobacter radiotolerans TaxID=42256 RepID=A0A023X1J8_RUBRA|nr:thiolase family protein [Rubrobacter radiotolerans]AHY46352.1 AcCoA-C-Actrans: acetyl-CoA C-acetyltransferase [Rubrobacter radiotolerans]MDX5893759.1 thiolase family protein [Rubrobacter radiotolerans]SMC04445.1 acetyl-CoA C-acetyltransferase [Rubrobacter radiotolerans DSM 5868]